MVGFEGRELKDALERISVKPVGITAPLDVSIPGADEFLSYMARVSNPDNQMNFKTADALLKHCAKEGHWSVFDMVDIIWEITAPRDISRQMLRHYSMRFQEFSQRYSDLPDDMFVLRELRMQDNENRQNSLECDNQQWKDEWNNDLKKLLTQTRDFQAKWRGRGAAKECCRVVNMEGLTLSSLYAKISVRTLTHYLDVRGDKATQKEHRLIVEKMLPHMPTLLPKTHKAITGRHSCENTPA